MRISIVIPVLNSHEVLRRQLAYWRKLNLTNDIEIIIMDDGSNPPLWFSDVEFEQALPNLQIIPTNDFRPWTWALARNAGARIAQGDYLFMVDLDYIITQDCLDAALAFTGDKLRFKREFGILDENGIISQDLDILRQYGLLESRIQEKGLRLPPHPNNFCIRRELYWEMGGYREDLIDRPYPQKEDTHFKRRWVEFVKAGKAKESEADDRPTLLMFPNGQFCGDVDHNPMGLFHSLSRKTEQNRAYMKSLTNPGDQ
jgi:glycosyltransferase involved in cell wall biosynthesis